jgi:hypothetical protein
MATMGSCGTPFGLLPFLIVVFGPSPTRSAPIARSDSGTLVVVRDRIRANKEMRWRTRRSSTFAKWVRQGSGVKLTSLGCPD